MPPSGTSLSATPAERSGPMGPEVCSLTTLPPKCGFHQSDLTHLSSQRQTPSMDCVPAGAIDGTSPKLLSTVLSRLKWLYGTFDFVPGTTMFPRNTV